MLRFLFAAVSDVEKFYPDTGYGASYNNPVLHLLISRKFLSVTATIA